MPTSQEGGKQRDSRGLLISCQSGLCGCLTHGIFSCLTRAVFIFCICKLLPFYFKHTFLALAVCILVLREAALSFTRLPALPEQISPALAMRAHMHPVSGPAAPVGQLFLRRGGVKQSRRRSEIAAVSKAVGPFPRRVPSLKSSGPQLCPGPGQAAGPGSPQSSAAASAGRAGRHCSITATR